MRCELSELLLENRNFSGAAVDSLQFDRERIPERVFHARGMVAKGYFELTEDISHLTSASLFNGVGKKTPVAFRGSTATHEKASPESELASTYFTARPITTCTLLLLDPAMLALLSE